MKRIVSAFVIFVGTAAFAADKKDLAFEFGTLKSVGTGQITLAGQEVFVKGKNAPERTPETTYYLSPTAKILLDGKTVKLLDLKTGMQLGYRLDANKRVVEISQRTAVAVEGPSNFGGTAKLKSIADGKLAVANLTKTFVISKTVKVKIDGKDAKLEDLKVGETVSYTGESKSMTIVLIEQKSKK